MQPIRHKSFDSPAHLTRWRDKQPAGTEIQGIAFHDGKQICYYRPAADDSNREDTVNERVLSHINAPAIQRRQLGYSPKLLEYPVAQFSLIRNSLRNLKCFRGLTPQETTDALETTVLDLGFGIVGATEARSLYGVSSKLIVKGEKS